MGTNGPGMRIFWLSGPGLRGRPRRGVSGLSMNEHHKFLASEKYNKSRLFMVVLRDNCRQN